MEYLKKIDSQLLKWAYQRGFKNSLPLRILIFIGDGPFWMIILFISALFGQFLGIDSFTTLSYLLILGFIISHMTFVQLKTRVKRRRPYANPELQKVLKITIENRDKGHGSKEFESFPSGHVLWTTLSVTIISFQFGYMGAALFGWLIPVMICLRPYLGVHYPSDALAGFLIGIINGSITIIIAPYFMELISSFKTSNFYFYGYWAFIVLFLIVGFKSWLKRI